MLRLFNICVRVFCASNVTILSVYIPAKIKISFIWNNFILRKSTSSLDFVQRHTKVFMQNSFQWCPQNVQLLRTTVYWCWWRFMHSFCHSSNILGRTHCFWLFTLWFIDEDASFSHTFCNITMILKGISQYFPMLFKRIHNHIRSAEE